MNGMELSVSFTVDWISATFDKPQGEAFLMQMWSDRAVLPVAVNPARGYNAAFQFESGLRYNINTERPEMGVHVVYSGSTLRWYWARGVEWKSLFEKISEHGGRTSRVDLAFDFKNSGLSPDFLCEPNLKSYKGRGRTPKFTTLSSGDGSWTVYVGSRSSEKFLRIYDKAKEQKDYVSDYVRVELETKGETAHAVGWNFARGTVQECIGMSRGLLLGVADFNVGAWNAGFEGGVVGMAIPKSTAKETRKWLMEVAASALAKEMLRHPSEGVFNEFRNEVARMVLKHSGDDTKFLDMEEKGGG